MTDKNTKGVSIQMLPLPESDCQPNWLRWLFPVDQRDRVRDYARAVAEHNARSLQVQVEELKQRSERLEEALRLAEAALADIGDADREPEDDLAWCERRAAAALPAVRAALRDRAPEGTMNTRQFTKTFGRHRPGRMRMRY